MDNIFTYRYTLFMDTRTLGLLYVPLFIRLGLRRICRTGYTIISNNVCPSRLFRVTTRFAFCVI